MAQQSNAPAQLALSPAQIMQLPAAQQQAYVSSLSPAAQGIYAQEVMNIGNMDFMRNGVRQPIYCPVTGGSGVSAAYTPGATLNFDLPSTQGYACDLIIRYVLAVTPATGTAATYQLTQAAQWAIFNRIVLNYGNQQINTHPYFLKVMDMAQGQMTGAQNKVLAGQNDGQVSAQIVDTTPLVVNAANVWQGFMRIRLNPISPESPFGLLPLNGQGNPPQLQLSCPSSLYGTDAMLNGICAGSPAGTGNAVTVTGTIKVDCVVIDGVNMEGVAAKSLQGLIGMPTMQYGWESSLTPFNANLLNTFTVKTKLEHWIAAAIIIDGQQSNTFISNLANLTSFGLAADPTFRQYFANFGISNNIPTYDWFDYQRRQSQQDFDEGVILWVNAPTRGVVDPSNRNGTAYLNCYGDGYPGATHGYQVGAVGAVCTPRVELFIVSKNRQGLQVGS
jgi:hypothetical protein